MVDQRLKIAYVVWNEFFAILVNLKLIGSNLENIKLLPDFIYEIKRIYQF